jgi:hypothetical protein
VLDCANGHQKEHEKETGDSEEKQGQKAAAANTGAVPKEKDRFPQICREEEGARESEEAPRESEKGPGKNEESPGENEEGARENQDR